jgi:hypothetical protein
MNRKFARWTLMAASFAMLAGCAALRDQAQVDWVTLDERQVFKCNLDVGCKNEPSKGETGQEKDDYQLRSVREWIELASLRGGLCLSDDAGNDTGGKDEKGSGDKAKTGDPKQCRNTAQTRLILLSNAVCERHLAGIHGYQSTWNLALKALSSSLAGVSAIVDGGAGKNYAAGAAFSGALQTTVNSEVYANMLSAAIITKIMRMRERARDEIALKRELDAERYSPADAIEDAMVYHATCSFYVGLQALVEEAGKRERSSLDTPVTLSSIKASLEARITGLKKLITEFEKSVPGAAADKPSWCRQRRDLQAELTGLESNLREINLSIAREQFFRTPAPAPAPTSTTGAGGAGGAGAGGAGAGAGAGGAAPAPDVCAGVTL